MKTLKQVMINNTEILFWVSRDGKVFSEKRGKMIELKPYTRKDGYQCICVTDRSRRNEITGKFKTRSITVHRMVAAAFLRGGDYYFENEVNHIDKNPSNNNIENLEIVTRRENLLHAEKIQYSYVYPLGSSWKAVYKNKYLGTFNTAEEASRFVKKYFEENGVPFCKYLKFA